MQTFPTEVTCATFYTYVTMSTMGVVMTALRVGHAMARCTLKAVTRWGADTHDACNHGNVRAIQGSNRLKET